MRFPPSDYFTTLYDAFGQRHVSTVFTQLNEYHLVMEVDQPYQQNPDALKNIYVKSPNGVEVPLSGFAHIEPFNTALQVNHQGQFPAVTLSFDIDPGDSTWRVLSIATLCKGGAGDGTCRLLRSMRAFSAGTAGGLFQDSLKNEWIPDSFRRLGAVYDRFGNVV